jgi:ABC-type phosphate transport system substrate-binding protein
VQIVDQQEESEVRKQFTREIHGRQVTSVKSYWQQMIFSGRDVPPPEKASDAEVLAFVAANPNAIGYVSAAAPSAPSVKAIEVAQ